MHTVINRVIHRENDDFSLKGGACGGQIRYGLLGRAISYTLSPVIYNTWFARRKIDAVFDLIDVSDYEHTVLDGAWQRGYRGLCVTIPYKTRVMSYPGLVLDAVAQSVGAANVLRYDGNDDLGHSIVRATNTDALAIDDIFQGMGIGGATAVVMGAGGAALATLWALKQCGVGGLTLAVRDVEKVEKICSVTKYVDQIVSIESLSDMCADIFINATSLGRKGETPSMPKGVSCIVDWVYQPREDRDLLSSLGLITGNDFPALTQPTPLIQMAKRQGISVIDGESLLIGQARRVFSFWFDGFCAN
jgi:shikimate dehydrogenase